MRSMLKSMLGKLHRLNSMLVISTYNKEGTFEKGFTPIWTEEVFTISSVKSTKLPTYTTKDTQGEPVQGAQLSVKGIFRIGRVLK